MRERWPTVYNLASRRNGTLYVGVTSDVIKRVSEHIQDLMDGFTKRYGVDVLGHYEPFPDMLSAIRREKQLKKTLRKDKIALIEKVNPGWRDLYWELSGPVDPDSKVHR